MIMIIAFEIEILSCKCQNRTTWVGESVLREQQGAFKGYLSSCFLL